MILLRKSVWFIVMAVCCFYVNEIRATIIAEDIKWDSGGQIKVHWELPASVIEMLAEKAEVFHISIFRKDGQEQGKIYEGTLLKGQLLEKNLDYTTEYQYVLRVINDQGDIVFETMSQPVIARAGFFDKSKLNLLIALLVLGLVIVHSISKAKRGAEIKVRRIPALESVDEAIGRATEMGKPILFIPGIMDIDDVQTVAGIIILGEVAYRSAQYDALLNVPVCRSMVMSTSRETVRESYLRAGRPDSYQENMIHYLTDDQFGYASGVDGIMLREKPAAIFMLGVFYAESLILAETGNSINAIQIAGTAMPSQLPFFIAACDYTLIGEELFAASAYLSKQPQMLGTLRGQDIGKLIIMIILIVSAALMIVFSVTGINIDLSRFFSQ